ncbi:MAG: hypothetical protein H7343_20315 [Undibacterium sp.]|nr:hypothetical protein [Opitutaceae bacterium]
MRKVAGLLKTTVAQLEMERRELFDLIGVDGAAAILDPKSTADFPQELIEIQTKISARETARKSTEAILRRVLPSAIQAPLALTGDLEALHTESREWVASRARDKIARMLGMDSTPFSFGVLLRNHPLVREQSNFEAVNMSHLSFDTAVEITNNVVRDLPHQSLYSDPTPVIVCNDRLAASVEAARARLADMKRQAIAEDAADPIGDLKKENAELKKLLASLK